MASLLLLQKGGKGEDSAETDCTHDALLLAF